MSKRFSAVVLTVISMWLVSCAPGEDKAQPGSTEPRSGPVAEKEVLYLARDGASDYRIVLASSASPSEKRAAEELRSYFKTCTGVDLPIVEEPPLEDVPMIVLGCGSAAQGVGVDPKAEEFGEQGYVLRTVSPHIVIAGTRGAGTLYGTYDFLENLLGVRWYAPGVTRTPQVAEVPLPHIDKLVRPAFAWRHASYAWPGRDAAFLAHVQDNNGNGDAENPHGLQYAFDGRAHSYFRYVSPDEFFAAHPEYFSEIGGVRQGFETQLCLTNPDMLELVTKRMLQRMAEMPQCRQHNFSQMDYYNYCQCDRCTAINEKYGTMGGTQYWFLNQLAERTAKVYPEKLIGTLAYIYTEEPPKGLKLHPNIAVWLCHMYPSCDSHPIAACPLNAEYKRRALEWSKNCSHLYVWHYIIDFAHYYTPFPNFRAMAADMKFYRDIGVEGIYLQGMSARGGGGEFNLLRPYYGMKLVWDPDQNPDTIMKDFLEGYYGAAWEPIWNYIKLLHDKVEREDIHMHLYTNPAQGYLTDDVMADAAELFDQAERAVAEDAELLERVRVARMPLTYARLFPCNGYRIEGGKLIFEGEFAQMAETQAFLDRMKRHGFKTLREWMGEPEQLLLFCPAMNTPMDIVTVSNSFLTVDVVPFLGGRALRITERESGECATDYNTARNLHFPFAGGEETRLGGIFEAHVAGNMDMYNVVEQTDESVTVETQTRNGFTIRRVLTLLPDRPVLNVKTVVTNLRDAPREARVRSHLELDLGDLAETRVRFSSRNGEDVEKDMRPIIAGLREGEHYYRGNAPKGAWTFTGTKNLEVTQTFDDGELDFTWLYAYPDYLGELEVEVWAKPVQLKKDESTTLSHTIEVRPL